jgi:hypothetical protein
LTKRASSLASPTAGTVNASQAYREWMSLSKIPDVVGKSKGGKPTNWVADNTSQSLPIQKTLTNRLNTAPTNTPSPTVQVDTTAPRLLITSSSVRGGGDYFRSAVTVSIVGTEAGSGVASIEYRLDGQDWIQADHVPITASGDHGFEGLVKDKAGNLTHRAIAIHIDTIPSVPTFIMPPSDSTMPIQGFLLLGGKVSDIGSGNRRSGAIT